MTVVIAGATKFNAFAAIIAGVCASPIFYTQ